MDSLFMEDIFSLDIEEPIIPDTARTDLYEMCHLLDEIEYLETVNDPWYLSEAVINPKDKKRGNAAKFISASKPMYSAITDANATAINTGMGFITKICQLAVKVWTFIVKIITWIPNAIAKTLNFIIHLPGDVFHKIKGNLELYIPIEAINTMYQKNVIVMLNSLISDGKDFMKGKAWDGFVKRILSDIMAGATLEIIKPNDKEMAKRITKKTQILNNITFTKTIIDMNNDKNKEIYFGQGIDGNNKMRVRKDKLDIIGKKMNYLQALQGLFNDITKKQNDLKEIVDTINDKLLSSQASGNWDKLDANYQYIIKNAISGMTASITFTGKVLKYITADMKTYQSVMNKIQKKNIKSIDKKVQPQTESMRYTDPNYSKDKDLEYNPYTKIIVEKYKDFFQKRLNTCSNEKIRKIANESVSFGIPIGPDQYIISCLELHILEDNYNITKYNDSNHIIDEIEALLGFGNFVKLYNEEVMNQIPGAALTIDYDGSGITLLLTLDESKHVNDDKLIVIAKDISKYIDNYYHTLFRDRDSIYAWGYFNCTPQIIANNVISVMRYMEDYIWEDWQELIDIYNLPIPKDDSSENYNYNAEQVIEYCNKIVDIGKCLDSVKKYISSKGYNITITSRKSNPYYHNDNEIIIASS